MNWIGKKIFGIPHNQRVFAACHGNYRFRDYRSTGLGSFVTFLAHQEK